MIIPILILRIRNDESTVRFSHAYSQTCALLGKRSNISHAVRVQQLKRSLSLSVRVHVVLLLLNLEIFSCAFVDRSSRRTQQRTGSASDDE